MSDHIARVREQAERASREAYDFNGVRGHDSRNGTRRKAFIAGAVWLAGRLTRENIARTLDLEGAQTGECGHDPGDAEKEQCECWPLLLRYGDAILALVESEGE